MKKLLTLLLCLVLALGIAACGSTEETTETGTDDGLFTEESDRSETLSSSDKTTDKTTNRKTDTSSNVTSEQKDLTVPPDGLTFDTEAEHKFFATDIKMTCLVIFDLNQYIGDLNALTDTRSFSWIWDPESDPKCHIMPGAGIDSAKLRYSPYFERDVVIACSSNGWAGVIDYEARSLLWEYNIGDGPHSIEMLPNGDVVVAGSGNGSTTGKIAYVPLGAGFRAPVFSIAAPSAHGVMWDPQNEVLWGLEMSRIVPYRVVNPGTKDAKLEPVEEDIVSLKGDSGGHVLSPVLGQPGKYWVTAGKVWLFDANEKTLSNTMPNYTASNQRNVKGMVSFPDGTFVQTVGGVGKKTMYDWSTPVLRIGLIRDYGDKGTLPLIKQIQFTNREFYKVFPVTKEYQ